MATRIVLLLSFVGCIARATAALGDDGQCHGPVGKDFLSGSPSASGLSLNGLRQLDDALDAGQHDIRALLIVRDCRLVYERYKEGIGRDHNHAVYSVTKSVSATLVGALLHQGKLASVELPISRVSLKPPSLSDSVWQKASRITLKNVMQMSSGLEYRHDPRGHPIYSMSVDRFAVALTPELTSEPGTKFNYSDGDASITGAVIGAMAQQNLYAFARATLFDPLLMINHAWPYTDAAGRPPGGWGLRLRPMDMAKLGQLYLQRGEWNSTRIFGERFTDLAWAAGPSRGYALHWWIGGATQAKGTPYFYASGFKGQRVLVFPTLRLVAALTSTLPDAESGAVHLLLVAALVEAASGEKTTASQPVQRQSFRGQSRTQQSEQDVPRAAP